MNKDFDSWNVTKKKVDTFNTFNLYFNEREIWWCYLGINIGYEINGKGAESLRPILILRKLSKDTFIGLPLTTTTKERKYTMPCMAMDKKFRQVVLSQLKTVDAKRLHKK